MSAGKINFKTTGVNIIDMLRFDSNFRDFNLSEENAIPTEHYDALHCLVFYIFEKHSSLTFLYV